MASCNSYWWRYGRFSLQLTGDAAFEKSKAAAQAEFDDILATAKEMKAEERNSPGYAEREAYRKTTGKVFEIPLIAELAEKNAARNRYALSGDKQADRYNQSVFDILKHFASWCEANMQAAKRERLLRVYELHVQGKSCGQIATAIGKRKGSISEDLACIEDLTGEKIRVGNPYIGQDAKPSMSKLLKKTRSVREQGQRSACLYGWHSCRVFFVVTAIDAGIRPDDLRLIVGHATVSMVLHYYNPEELVAAEKMRAQLRRNRKKSLPAPPTAPTTGNTALLAATIQSILDNPDLTPEARNAAILALTAKG